MKLVNVIYEYLSNLRRCERVADTNESHTLKICPLQLGERCVNQIEEAIQ